MHLSTFTFNRARRGSQRLLGSPHILHAAVLSGFIDPSAQQAGRVLWRLDNQGHNPVLIIVSPEQPDLTHLAEQAGWPTLDNAWSTRPYDPLLDRIEDGHRYRFRLTANPVHNVRQEPGKRGTPRGHVTVSQQLDWLIARQEKNGFAAESMTPGGILQPAIIVRDRKLLTFTRRDTTVTLRVVTFEGSLMVTDRSRFVHALTHGIGRAKGYGCGLLTIAPASNG